VSTQHANEVRSGARFAFGANWSRFLARLTDRQIDEAVRSIQDRLGVKTLRGKSFLDVGSGSGLFSLAARRLGAAVHSLDYDPVSVACTAELRGRYSPNEAEWTIAEGSILDDACIAGLARFDVVYSWGVLHHTGDMIKAWTNVAQLVAPGGTLFLAIYNDQGWISRYWTLVKRLYNRGPVSRILVATVHVPYLFGLRYLVRRMTGRLALERGMSMWRDTIDWLGGFPFEVAKPEAVFRFFRQLGFSLEELRTCGGRMGCNEFVFRRTT
jgi:2-polyprenyl-3-methyl-5-hydroxy-6-metoxy-1,4-benzoquinol methylase